jgi:hypothetical protein
MSNPNRGAALTREHLTENGLHQADLARACSVSDVTALNWLRCHIKPKKPRRKVIERWTHGKVPAKSWDEPAALVCNDCDPADPALDEGRPSMVA